MNPDDGPLFMYGAATQGEAVSRMRCKVHPLLSETGRRDQGSNAAGEKKTRDRPKAPSGGSEMVNAVEIWKCRGRQVSVWLIFVVVGVG